MRTEVNSPQVIKAINASIKKRDLADTLAVFAYFISPDSLFFEFVSNLKDKKCHSCGNPDNGKDLIFEIIRLFGGTTIKIPHHTEIELYKYMIMNPESVMHTYKVHGLSYLERLLRKLLEIPPEVNIDNAVLKFVNIINDSNGGKQECPIKKTYKKLK